MHSMTNNCSASHQSTASGINNVAGKSHPTRPYRLVPTFSRLMSIHMSGCFQVVNGDFIPIPYWQAIFMTKGAFPRSDAGNKIHALARTLIHKVDSVSYMEYCLL